MTKITKYSKITLIPDEILELKGIYKIISPSNKIYIGSTNVSFRKRFGQHFGDSSKNLIKKAFNKYGRDNFHYEILEIIYEEIEDRKLREIETEYIEKYKSYDKSIGYNILKNANECIATGMRKIIQFNYKGEKINEFPSIIKAANELNITPSSISYCCRNCNNEYQPYTTKYKYRWLYEEDYINGVKINLKKEVRIRGRFPIYQKDINGEVIKKWNQLSEIKKELNFDESTISKCCKNKLKKAYGFRWEYVNPNQKIRNMSKIQKKK